MIDETTPEARAALIEMHVRPGDMAILALRYVLVASALFVLACLFALSAVVFVAVQS